MSEREAHRFRYGKSKRGVLISCKTGPVFDLADLTAKYREFSKERDWEKFHDPRSLILALVGEVGELAELFQWEDPAVTESEISRAGLQQRASEEVADVFLYLIRLADVLQIDLLQAASLKLARAEERFPSSRFSGIAPNKLA